jgi:hypothetical protein
MLLTKSTGLAMAALILIALPAVAQTTGSIPQGAMGSTAQGAMAPTAQGAMGSTAQGAMGSTAQGAMGKGAMGLSKADASAVKTCNAMSRDAAAKSAKCQRLAKAHPGAVTSIANTGAM